MENSPKKDPWKDSLTKKKKSDTGTNGTSVTDEVTKILPTSFGGEKESFEEEMIPNRKKIGTILVTFSRLTNTIVYVSILILSS